MKAARPLQHYAALRTLRPHPAPARERSWAKKFAAMRAAGFDGVFSPPRPELSERGALGYLAVTGLGVVADCSAPLAAARALGAEAIKVQLCNHDTPLRCALGVARRIHAAALAHGRPNAIKTHRDTFTETPEATPALARAHHAPPRPSRRFRSVSTSRISPSCATSHPPKSGTANGSPPPAYRLASSPDTWRDARVVAADLRRLWHATV